MKKYLSAYANDHFAKICQECQSEPVLIERYNKPHVVMVSYKDFKRLSKSSQNEWALLATTALMEGFMDDEEVDEWLTSIKTEEYRWIEEDNYLNDQYFCKIKLTKNAQKFLGQLSSGIFLKVIDAFFDDKHTPFKLGKWPYYYKDIGTYRFIYDVKGKVHRLLCIKQKSKLDI